MDEQKKIARPRSPNFPMYSIRDAVASAQTLYDKDKLNPIDRTVAAKHLGYESAHGPAARILASLNQYGLIEDAGSARIRLSELARAILLPKKPDERREATVKAFRRPRVFASLLDAYGADLPSPETIVACLIRDQGFTHAAALACEKSLRDGLEYVGSVSRNPEQAVQVAGASQATPGPDPDELLPTPRADASEMVAARLPGPARAEIRLTGHITPETIERFEFWVDTVVKAWAKFTAMPPTADAAGKGSPGED